MSSSRPGSGRSSRARSRFDAPAGPGTYILAVRVHWETVLTVGGLGERVLAPGLYLYAGSALGPGGLRARLGRHAGFSRSPHWHIDHLTNASSPVEAWLHEGRERLEHEWAGALSSCGWACGALPGFGSSDCRCPTHLFVSSVMSPWPLFRGMVRQETFRIFPERTP